MFASLFVSKPVRECRRYSAVATRALETVDGFDARAGLNAALLHCAFLSALIVGTWSVVRP